MKGAPTLLPVHPGGQGEASVSSGCLAMACSIALIFMPIDRAIAFDKVAQILQTSPVAGFQHYAGAALFPLMRQGDVLVLSREPDNPHDPRAVRVFWHGVQIGYAPRLDNADLARIMDRGVGVEGRILHLQISRDPWKRVLMEIVIPDQ